MNIDPIESPPPERLWIDTLPYNLLLSRLSGGVASAASQATGDTLLLAGGVITEATGEARLLPWYQLEPGAWTPPTPGPYKLVFLNAVGQEIAGYSRPFTVANDLQPAALGPAMPAASDPVFFTLKVPYPAAAARVQLRRTTDDTVLAEVTPAAQAPSLSLDPPGSASWHGPQTLTWQSEVAGNYFAVDVSTDGGASWQALAINLTAPSYTLETASLPDTSQALVRVSASSGLRTTTVVTGPFRIDNPPLVAYVSPLPGETDVSIVQPIVIGFRDAMDPASITGSVFTLSGGPFVAVTGVITYDAETREATLMPKVALAYSTTYTAHITTQARAADGQSLPAAYTWTFHTQADAFPPVPVAFSPANGALNAPRSTQIVAAWDKPLAASSLTAATFRLTDANGSAISGVVSYNAASQTAVFSPTVPLTANTRYVARLKAGIQAADGNTTVGDSSWSFTTGDTLTALAFTGSYADWGQDTNGDGLYEQLVIRVGVQVTQTGVHVLRGSLVDADGGEITWDFITRTLTAGVHFLDLRFDGAAIGGRGLDGPYTLTDLTLTRGMAAVSQRDAYRTFAHPAAHFPAPLRFGGLPDVILLPGTTTRDAFNVRDYTQHITRTSDQLRYTVMLNSNPRMSVTLQSSGVVRVVPEPYWEGRASVTIRVSDGIHTVQDTFEAAVGWPQSLYLPLTLRSYSGLSPVVARDGWLTFIKDDFEHESFGWGRSSWYSDLPPDPIRWYFWGNSDCRAYSGHSSAWAYGYSNDGPLPPCDATYPDMLGTRMYKTMPFNLKYVAKAEYSTKIWTNLAPGDKVCLRVATDPSDKNCQWATYYDGACRSGQTNGWEDLKIDLSNVPTLGNLLGKEQVCLAVDFQADEAGTRPEGAYVDDVTLRACPEGLTGYCAGTTTLTDTPPYTETPMTRTVSVGSNIGGYPEAISEVALAVESSGRVHALWTGKLNDAFNTYVFYSSSSNGDTWTPYKILSYWGGREPRIAVDNIHGRVHLAYGNDDGIVHHTVVNGVVSAPEVVAPRTTYYLPGLNLPSGGVGWPSLAVAEQTGYAYLTWDEVYYVKLDAITYTTRHRTWHATWDGAKWSAPLRKINDEDTFYSTIAAAPDGQTMLAWFQRWQQSSGGGYGPGDPIVARTAYGTEPGSFPLRQATHNLYTTPERDESILLAYSGGDDSFVLVSNHMRQPGHSRAYRYVWKNGAWSEYLSVAGNTSGWGVPFYVGAAKNTPLIRYVYSDNWTLKTRTETNGVLGPAQTIADYLSARGYSGSPAAYFTDAAGGLHMIISGEKIGVAGFYYVKP